jgi:hypothetical protein
MSQLEQLLAVASPKTKELALQMIGEKQLALLIANAVISQTSGKLDSEAIAQVFDITEHGARQKAKIIVPKKGHQ